MRAGQLQIAITSTAMRAAAGTTIGGTNQFATTDAVIMFASKCKKPGVDRASCYAKLLLLLLVGLRRILAALLTTLLAALILLAGLLVALRILLRARLVLVGHESLFSEKDLKKIFQVPARYGYLGGPLPASTASNRRLAPRSYIIAGFYGQLRA